MSRLAAACLALALALVAFPVRSETYVNSGPRFAIDYPEGWRILPGEGGLATRAVGPGSAMNVSVTAASHPDFDAERFTGAELEQIASRLAAATASALRGFELIDRGRAELGGKPAAFFSYRAVVDSANGPVETVGHYFATAHRGLVYSVTGVTQKRLQRRMQPVILEAVRSFRFNDPA
jgi:hypothetical protein